MNAIIPVRSGDRDGHLRRCSLKGEATKTVHQRQARGDDRATERRFRLGGPAGRATLAAAGPVAIVAAVLVVLREFAFDGEVSSQHPDVLAFWLPNYCYLGRSLAAGHIPAWNPYVMGGVRFAADPQSGWMSLPPMALFTALPCDVAIRWMIVLQPVLAGLGLYAFLRGEGLARPAATVGGISAAMVLCGSRLGLFLPFSAALAWTALTLAACSRFFRAPTPSTRLLWAGLTALAWGQLAAAHLGHGAVIGTLALASLCAVKAWTNVRGGGWTVRSGLGLGALLVSAIALVNLAFFVPRLAYLPDSSYGPASLLSPLEGLRGLTWPLALATAPGGYLGIVALALSAAGMWSRFRPLAVGFAVFGAASYVFGLQPVAELVAPALEDVPVLSLYSHFPGRFSLGLVLALPILGGLGAQALIESRRGLRTWLPILPVAVLWVAGPLLVGMSWQQVAFLAAGAGAATVALAIGAHRPTWAAVIPALLAVEVVATGLAGQHEWAILAARSSRVDALGQPSWLSPMVEANIDAASYLRPDSNVDVLQEAGTIRYLSIAPEIADRRGYLVNQRAKNWGLEANQRAILFGIEDAQGYNPIQLRRYWEFVRTVSAVTVAYNAAFFEPVTPAVMDLMHVGYVITQQGQAVEPGSVPASRVGEWVLWRRQDVPPRASVVSSMVTVAGPEQALERVSAPGFDPSATAVVERSYQDVVLDALPRAEPGSSRTEGSGTRRESTARYVSRGSQAARVEVEASAPSLLVVRNPYDRHWRATVDGRPAPLVPVDHLLQGVPVPAGRHVVELAYDDPWVGYGLAGSAVSLAVLMGAAGVLQRRRSAPKGPPPQPPD